MMSLSFDRDLRCEVMVWPELLDKAVHVLRKQQSTDGYSQSLIQRRLRFWTDQWGQEAAGWVLTETRRRRVFRQVWWVRPLREQVQRVRSSPADVSIHSSEPLQKAVGVTWPQVWTWQVCQRVSAHLRCVLWPVITRQEGLQRGSVPYRTQQRTIGNRSVGEKQWTPT